MAHPNHGVDVATGVEVSFQLYPYRIGGRYEVIKDPVRHLFMGDRSVAVAIDVQLDRLELHHPGPGLVDQAYHCEIGVAGEGALASELGQLNRDLIGPPRPGVLERDQFSFSDGTLAVLRRLGLLVGH